MDIAFLDNLAVNGQGLLHQAKAWSKLAMFMIILMGVLLNQHLLALFTLTGLILLLLLLERLPVLRLLPFLGYPSVFSALFAFLTHGWSLASLGMILKAITVVLALLALLATTSPGEIFQSLRKFLPQLISDGLFVTYRCLFVLINHLHNHLTALKLRGGYTQKSFWKNIPGIASSLGLIFIHSWEMAERMYNIMALRGYQGRIGLPLTNHRSSLYDLWPLGWGIIFGGVSIYL